jgi:hypothetical protein
LRPSHTHTHTHSSYPHPHPNIILHCGILCKRIYSAHGSNLSGQWRISTIMEHTHISFVLVNHTCNYNELPKSSQRGATKKLAKSQQQHQQQ